MILSNFLSRQKVDDSDTNEIIPISFNIRSVLHDKYYSLNGEKEKFMVQTRSQMKAIGVQLPEVHGSRKGLDPHKIPEKQWQPIIGLDVDRKPRLGQGRAGVRRKIKAPPSSFARPGATAPRPITVKDETSSILPKSISEIPRSEILPPYLAPQSRPPPKPPDQLSKRQEVDESKTEIEENLPFQENIISKIYERPDKSYFQELVKLKDLVNTKNIIQ